MVPYPHVSEADVRHHFTYSVLRGPDRLPTLPIVFQKKSQDAVVGVVHLGRSLCGHDGIVHGGMLATIIDEMAARAVIPSLPGMRGFTAYLNTTYKKPVTANQTVVVRAWVTKLERRKGFGEARLESLEGVVLAEASYLFIVPASAADPETASLDTPTSA